MNWNEVVNLLITAVLAPAVLLVVQHILKVKKTGRIEQSALEKLEDPTNDITKPEDAVVQAIVEEEKSKVNTMTRRVRETLRPKTQGEGDV